MSGRPSWFKSVVHKREVCVFEYGSHWLTKPAYAGLSLKYGLGSNVGGEESTPALYLYA